MTSPKIDRHDSSTRMSQIVVCNGMAYLAGQVATDADADIKTQTQQVLQKIDDCLAKAGTNRDRLVSAMIWLRDIDNDFAPMNEVWEAWIADHGKPARATVQGSLATPKLKVEIQVTAAL